MAIVLNWNGGDLTRACLASLREVRSPVRLPVLGRILADNGSTDGSVEAALAEDPELTVLRLGDNYGYAGGNNRAVEHALAQGADWVCLVNNDVEVSAAMFERLLDGVAQAEADGPVGAAGPCLVYADDPDRIWACGGRIGTGWNVTQLLGHGSRRAATDDDASPRDVDYVPGTCLLFSRRAWEAAGPLDEDFFCYLEDADWCARLRAAGLRCVVVPGAVARHALSASTGGGYSPGRKYMTAVNSVRFLRKHGGVPGWASLIVFDLLLWPLALLRGLLRGHAAGAVAKLKGVLDGLRGVRVDAAVAARYARRAT